MKISKIQGTCSMVELHDFNLNTTYIKTKSEFELNLRRALNTYKAENPKDATKKVLLYNTNSDWMVRFNLWYWGFKHLYSYKGNSSRRCHVMIKHL